MAIFGKAHWDPRGKHCYVTGGSSGTGAALAVLLAKQGAHVSIVARNEERLVQVTQEMEAARQSKDQRFRWYSYSLSSSSGSEAALKAASEPFGGACPEAVFLCAGFSKPGFFIEQDEESMMNGMDSTYWVQAWSALAAAKTMVRQDVKGKIAFMSSVLGYMSIIGYSTYSPGKHALRGLAETLRSELQLYDISVHIQFPGTIQGASLEEEKKVKPKITLKIEETDVGAPSEAIAKSFLNGVKKGDFHITVDFITDVFRSTTRGSSPFGSILDLGYEFIGTIALLFWRRSVDSTIRNHREEHRQYLRERGLIDEGAATKWSALSGCGY